MPGRYFLTTPVQDLAALVGMPEPPAEPSRINIRPGQEVLTVIDEGFRHVRWGIIPSGRTNARGKPVLDTIINARSETLFEKSAFKDVGWAVVPASGWYEWTGETRRKTAWRIQPKDKGVLWFAAIYDVWKAPNGVSVAQVATVTCPPNDDVRDIHDRMGVLLDVQDTKNWLTGDEVIARRMFRPWPKGRLDVSRADGIDWD